MNSFESLDRLAKETSSSENTVFSKVFSRLPPLEKVLVSLRTLTVLPLIKQDIKPKFSKIRDSLTLLKSADKLILPYTPA